MPDVVITSTTNSVKVDFGDFSSSVGYSKGVYGKSDIQYMTLKTDHVEVVAADSARWICAASNATVAPQSLIISTIDGVGPTSLSDLYDKLSALLA